MSVDRITIGIHFRIHYSDFPSVTFGWFVRKPRASNWRIRRNLASVEFKVSVIISLTTTPNVVDFGLSMRKL